MGTTIETIRNWLTRAKPNDRYLIVACDCFDYEDYPVFATEDEFAEKYARVNDRDNMQKVMEVYDLKANTETQLCEVRAHHGPNGE